MPGFYGGGEYDLAGCIIGVVDRARLIDGRSIRPGDAIWAFPSSGLHTNGYSLARKIVFEEARLSIDDEIPGTGASVREALLAVHRSYLPEIRDLRSRVEIKGLAHITGGGLLENIPRILPAGAAVEIDSSKWEVPPLFRFLKKRGGVEWTEMHRVFNMGIGMVVIVPAGADEAVARGSYRWRPFPIGRVVAGKGRCYDRMTGKLSREIVDAILETMPLEMTVIDENDRIVWWNTRRPRFFERPDEGARPRRARVPFREEPRHGREAAPRDEGGGAGDARASGTTGSPMAVLQKLVVDYFAIRDGERPLRRMRRDASGCGAVSLHRRGKEGAR